MHRDEKKLGVRGTGDNHYQAVIKYCVGGEGGADSNDSSKFVVYFTFLFHVTGQKLLSCPLPPPLSRVSKLNRQEDFERETTCWREGEGKEGGDGGAKSYDGEKA